VSLLEKTLRNIEVLNTIQSLKNILQVKDLSMKTNWNLVKNMKKLENILNMYIEREKELVNEYALKDEDLKIRFDDNKEPKFATKMKSEYLHKRDELLGCENVMDFLTVKLSSLESHGIAGADIFNIEFMIENDLDDEK
jgi:hypothetical protein